MEDFPQSKAIETLRKIPIYADLLDAQYQELLDVCIIGQYCSGDVIFKENDQSYALYVSLVGKINIQTVATGLLCTMKAGDLFGEIGVVSQTLRTASAIATEDLVLLEFSRDSFDFLLVNKPTIMTKILRNIATVLAERLINNTNQPFIL